MAIDYLQKILTAKVYDGDFRTLHEVQTVDGDQPPLSLAVRGDILVTGGSGHVRVYHRGARHHQASAWTLVQTIEPEGGVVAPAYGEDR